MTNLESQILEHLMAAGGGVHGPDLCEAVYSHLMATNMYSKPEAQEAAAEIIIGLARLRYVTLNDGMLGITSLGRLAMAKVFESPPDPIKC